MLPSDYKLIGQIGGKISERYSSQTNGSNYVKPLFFEVSPLNPLPGHLFDKSQILTTLSLGQSFIES